MRKIVDVIIIIVIMVSFIVVGAIDFMHREPIMYSATIDTSSLIRLLDPETGDMSSNLTSTWQLATNWTSDDVISAQTWITVDIIGRPTDEHNHSSMVQLYFPGAHTENPKYDGGHLLNAKTNLTDSSGSGVYKGQIKIMYQSEGEKCVILVEPTLIERTSYPGCFDEARPVIHISSADSKFQFETGKVNMFILWLGVGFSSASIWWYVREVWKG